MQCINRAATPPGARGSAANDLLRNKLNDAEQQKLLHQGLTSVYGEMKKQPITTKSKKKIDWDAVCERTRQRCNKLSEEERHRFRAETLRIIYSADAEAPTRSR